MKSESLQKFEKERLWSISFDFVTIIAFLFQIIFSTLLGIVKMKCWTQWYLQTFMSPTFYSTKFVKWSVGLTDIYKYKHLCLQHSIAWNLQHISLNISYLDLNNLLGFICLLIFILVLVSFWECLKTWNPLCSTGFSQSYCRKSNSVRTLKAKRTGCAMWNLNILGEKREVLSRRINKEQKSVKYCEYSPRERNQSGSHKDTALTILNNWKRFREKTSWFL